MQPNAPESQQSRGSNTAPQAEAQTTVPGHRSIEFMSTGVESSSGAAPGTRQEEVSGQRQSQLRQLDATVEDFRSGRVDKNPEANAARDRADRGQGTEIVTGQGGTQPSPENERPHPNQSCDIDRDDAERVDKFLQTIQLSDKRKSADDGDDSIKYEPVGRKRKIDPSKLSWAETEREYKQNNDPYFHRTFEILEYMGRDITEAERLLSLASSAPPGFPPSQWKRIITGQTVDLDVVHSHKHHSGSSKQGLRQYTPSM
ncbi:hypothetical protein H0H93_004745 [Arthromyces matolae]|nr:hypothetical protein H0H93_004745 [Arthromyces matolae]